MSPKFMPGKADEPLLSFSIESDNSIIQIGYSFDYDVCKGQDSNPRTPSVKCPCITFVNKSVEKMCDRHKLEVEQTKLAKIKGSRMNMITQNVDINLLKMKEKLDFGQAGTFRKDNRPLEQMTKEEAQRK